MNEKWSDEETLYNGSIQHLGVFDSGLGGLTVLRALLSGRSVQQVTYFGDTARVPYGAKSPDAVRRYAQENAHFLLSMGIDALVIACNTASAYALEALQSELPIPVIGMVEPGVEATMVATKGRVGVLATEGTIRSGVYQAALEQQNGIDFLKSCACPLLVPLVEEGLLDHPATELIASDYLRPLLDAGIDTLLLACTHYPLLRPLLERLCGNEVTIVDSAEACARFIGRESSLETPSCRFFVSDDPEKFKRVGQRFLGCALERVELIDLAATPM